MKRFSLIVLLLALGLSSCEKDDNDPDIVPDRDRGEQEIKDQEAIKEYLETHFYNYEDFENPSEDFDYSVVIDTIDGANSDKIPLIESDRLESKTFHYEGVDYTLYVLTVREGVGEHPRFTDSTLVSYRGELLNQSVFDASVTPVWFDLTRLIPGMSQALPGFGGASDFEVQPDNTVVWSNDYGIGAVIIPSGLGYFSTSRDAIPAYSPLVFSFKVFGVNDADHDRDGLLSWKEDLNEDQIIGNDDTNGDLIANYTDSDDDGDFIPTREEIVINEDGSISFPDKDGDGTPDYLDPDN